MQRFELAVRCVDARVTQWHGAFASIETGVQLRLSIACIFASSNPEILAITVVRATALLTRNKDMKARKSLSVAQYIAAQIAISGVPQKYIASALGYKNPNVVTMIKQGRTKLPVNKVGPLAEVLKVDSVHLLRLVMSEYCPDTWKAIEDLVGRSLISEREMAIIYIVRQTCGANELSLEKMKDRMALGKAISVVAADQFKTAYSFD